MTAHVLIAGFVQGVGFRNFVKKHALELGLDGWVKNLPDKRLEAYFSGSQEKIHEMVKLCKKGPFLSEVEKVEFVWVSEEKFDGFKISR